MNHLETLKSETAKPRVLMISVRADHGGGPAQMYLLAKHLRQDFEIFLALPKEPPYWDRFAELLGKDRLTAIPHREFTLSALWHVIRVILRNKINVIHSHGKGAGIYGRLASILTRTPIVHTFHGVHLGEYSQLKRILYIEFERFLVLVTDRIIAVSMSEVEMFDELRLAPPERIALIENGIDLPMIDQWGGSSSGPFRVVMVTRFDYAKNPELLCEIIESTFQHTDSCDLIFDIVGDGEGCEAVMRRLQSLVDDGKVCFRGTLDDPRQVMTGAGCYLSTSRWEGLPLALLEACTLRLPIVASDVAGNRDIVIDGVNGRLYPLNEPEMAAVQILALSTDREKGSKMGHVGRKIVEERYSAKLMAAKTAALYRDVISL